MELIKLILSKFVNPIPYQLFILSLLISGAFWLYLFSLIPNDLISDLTSVYAGDGSEESKPNPYKFEIRSPFFNQALTVDLISVGDVTALSLIGKFTVGAIKNSPASIKTVSGVITMGGLGGIYLGSKYLNLIEDREHTLKTSKDEVTYRTSRRIPDSKNYSNETSTDSDINNFKPSSPLENEELLDNVLVVLTCTKIVLFLAIISFILFSLYLSLNNNNIDKFENKYIIKFINLIKKSAQVYTLFWGFSTFIYLNGSLYLIIRLFSILERFKS